MLEKIRPHFVFFTFAFVIPILNSIFHTYSYGILILAVILQLLYKLKFSINLILYALLILVLINIQVTLTAGFNFKSNVSSVVYMYCCMVFFVLGKYLLKKENLNEYRAYYIWFFIVCLTAMISYAISKFSNYKFFYNVPKPCFPFQEPSHLALFIGPIIVAYSGQFANMKRFISSAILGFFALYFESITFLFFTIISVYLNLIQSRLILKLVISLVALFTLISIDFFNEKYLYLRFYNLFVTEIINMSILVYLQGWNSVYESLAHHPFGLGFQFLGNEEPNYYSIRIKELSGNFVNRQDGGFLLAKFISEFGYLGLCILIYFIFRIKMLYRECSSFNNSNLKSIYFLLFSLIVPLLFRDVGYFSYTSFYLFISLGYIFTINRFRIFN